MVILHGAGSSKESHADFGRACAANGWAAVSYDQRGHGESTDLMTPAALADVGRMASLIASRPGVDPQRICVRGSSFGGYLAIHAAATEDSIAGAIDEIDEAVGGTAGIDPGLGEVTEPVTEPLDEVLAATVPDAPVPGD